jgi:hypothetical protein
MSATAGNVHDAFVMQAFLFDMPVLKHYSAHAITDHDRWEFPKTKQDVVMVSDLGKLTVVRIKINEARWQYI